MLTNEEIKNLKIGDEIYIFGKKDTIISLDLFNVVTTNASCMITTNKLSLSPPKKKKKYWLWAYKRHTCTGYSLAITINYYDKDFINLDGTSIQTAWKQKLEYTMIEIEE